VQKFKDKRRTISTPATDEKGPPSKTKATKVALASKESIEFVPPSEIIVCMASSNYTTLFLTGGRKKLISKTLKEFEDVLLPHHFYRVHNSHLVNLDHVREYIKTDGGYLVMQNDMKVPVSKNRKDELLQLLQR
jgi:two-component system LytT family response regulator